MIRMQVLCWIEVRGGREMDEHAKSPIHQLQPSVIETGDLNLTAMTDGE
jgi:hypothetical protein